MASLSRRVPIDPSRREGILRGMERTVRVLNELQAEGVIGAYAIGGAMAAIFYAEAVLTYDLDVFVALPQTSGGLLTLAPLYAALSSRGYEERGECVIIQGTPVQFLPSYNALIEEALASANEVMLGSTPTRVMRCEHLLAIAVQTGRAKDRDRVRMLSQQSAVNYEFLAAVLDRHDLRKRWTEWTQSPLR